MKKLTKLKEAYEKLGQEIARLEAPTVVTVNLKAMPNYFKVHVADKAMKWEEAMNYATSIGMRLPTVIELLRIAESGLFTGMAWTSCEVKGYVVTFARYVNTDSGDTQYDYKSDCHLVMCVA